METNKARSDAELTAAIQHFMGSYPPLAHDRHRIQVEVHEGAVTLRGYVKSTPTYQHMMSHIGQIDGVKAVSADGFFDDESIRLHLGAVLPMGVVAYVEYGSVILEGHLPAGSSEEDLVNHVGQIAGVHHVYSRLK